MLIGGVSDSSSVMTLLVGSKKVTLVGVGGPRRLEIMGSEGGGSSSVDTVPLVGSRSISLGINKGVVGMILSELLEDVFAEGSIWHPIVPTNRSVSTGVSG